jgi:hypothetical protein
LCGVLILYFFRICVLMCLEAVFVFGLKKSFNMT